MERKLICVKDSAEIIGVDRRALSLVARKLGITPKPLRLKNARGFTPGEVEIIRHRLNPVTTEELAAAS